MVEENSKSKTHTIDISLNLKFYGSWYSATIFIHFIGATILLLPFIWHFLSPIYRIINYITSIFCWLSYWQVIADISAQKSHNWCWILTKRFLVDIRIIDKLFIWPAANVSPDRNLWTDIIFRLFFQQATTVEW